MFWNRNSMLSKLKNIAKTMEGYSKSHFSYICNEVDITTLRPPILERFLDPESSQNRYTTTSKSWSKIVWFSITLFNNFGSILDPLGDLWESQGRANKPFFVVLHSPGHQNSSKTSPRSLRDPPKPQFSLAFLNLFSRFGEDFSQCAGWFHGSSFAMESFMGHVSARWREGRRQLDIIFQR